MQTVYAHNQVKKNVRVNRSMGFVTAKAKNQYS